MNAPLAAPVHPEHTMQLSHDWLGRFREHGFVLLPNAFSPAEVHALRRELPGIFEAPGASRIVEARSGAVRSVYGIHRTHDAFRRLAADARLVEPARQVVGDEVYVYQFKVNAKAAFAGDLWEWHQDYVFWRNEDGMPSPRVTNVALLLDDVTEFNGPMYFVPGSHRRGVIDVAPHEDGAGGGPAWVSNLTASLKYGLDRRTVADLCTEHGLASPKGPAGSLLLFDSNVVHASPSNISPFDRVMVIATYNSVSNAPPPGGLRRPDFLVSRDTEPVRPIHAAVVA